MSSAERTVVGVAVVVTELSIGTVILLYGAGGFDFGDDQLSPIVRIGVVFRRLPCRL